MSAGRTLMLASLLALCASGCGDDAAVERGGDGGAAPDRAQVEEFTRLQIPAGAAQLQAASERGQDAAMAVRFTVPRGELDAFSEDLGPAIDRLPFTTHTIGDLTLDVTGVERFEAYKSDEPGFAREVVIDLDDPDEAVVNVFAFTL